MKKRTNRLLFILLWISTVLLTITICYIFVDSKIVVNVNGGQVYYAEEGKVTPDEAESIEAGVPEIAESENSEPDVININTAEKEELMEIPGIGDKTSDKIIKYRESKKFDAKEDIMQVKGIGESTFSKIKDYITVN